MNHQYINLINWRQNRLARLRKLFLFDIAIVFILALSYVIVQSSLWSSKLGNQKVAINYLKQNLSIIQTKNKEFAEVEKTKKYIMENIQNIQKLKYIQKSSISAWQALSSSIPKKTYLISIVKNKNTITVEGHSNSGGEVSQFIENLKNSHVFESPHLQHISIFNTNKHSNKSLFKIILPIAKYKLQSNN